MIVRNPLGNCELTGSENIVNITVRLSRCCDRCLGNNTKVRRSNNGLKCRIWLCQLEGNMVIVICDNLFDLGGIGFRLRHILRTVKCKLYILRCNRRAIREACVLSQGEGIFRVTLHLVALCQIRNKVAIIIDIHQGTVHMFHKYTGSGILLSCRIQGHDVRGLGKDDICLCDISAAGAFRCCLSLTAACRRGRCRCIVSASARCQHHCCSDNGCHRSRCCSFFHSHALLQVISDSSECYW